MSDPNKKLVCRWCGVNVGMWYFGWKHQASWNSKPACPRKLTDADVITKAEWQADLEATLRAVRRL